MALLAFIDRLWQLYVVYLLMAVGAASMHVGAISNVVGLWFDRQRGLALSLALNGASSGGILITPALVLAIAHYGFADAMIGSAALMAVVLMPIIALWIGRPPVAVRRRQRAPAATSRRQRGPAGARCAACRSGAWPRRSPWR